MIEMMAEDLHLQSSLTVFRCFLADPPPPSRAHLEESRSKLTNLHDAGPSFESRREHTYTPAHINQRASMPLHSQHANRLKKRPRRSEGAKSNQPRQQSRQSATAGRTTDQRVPVAWSARSVHGKHLPPSLPPPPPSPLLLSQSTPSLHSSAPPSSYVPLSSMSFSPMLSSSILAAQINPPYVSGSSHHSSSASANRMESLQNPRKNITAQVGHPVYLHCIVESLGDKMVKSPSH